MSDVDNATPISTPVGRPDLALKSVSGGLFLSLGPVVAAMPRAMPVWAILTTLVVGVRLYRSRGISGILPRRSLATLLTVAFLVLLGIGATWSPSWRAAPTAIEVGYVALGGLVIGRFITVVGQDELSKSLDLFAIGMICGVAIWTFNLAFDHPVHRWLTGASNVINNDANVPKRTAAAFTLLIWPFAFVAWRRLGPLKTLAVTLAVTAVLATWTDSRSAIFGMTLGALAFGASWISRTITRNGMMFVVAALFVAAVPTANFLAQSDVVEDERIFSSARHRIEIWGRAASRVPDAPILGHGIDAAREMRPRPGESSRFEVLTDHLFSLHPHNAFLELWLETGAVGVALALGLLFRLFFVIGRAPPNVEPFLIAQLATGIMMASAAYGIWQAWWMCSFLAGALMSATTERWSRINAASPIS